MDADRPTLRETDEGKTVVDDAGESIGMVTAVRDDGLYVFPDPSLVDRVKATLDWEGHDEDAYRVDRERVVQVTGTEVVITDEGDEERSAEGREAGTDDEGADEEGIEQRDEDQFDGTDEGREEQSDMRREEMDEESDRRTGKGGDEST
ncbi:hypothetical protein [Halorientalis halophila]|uniref:hypothetical protein n=1 Tax=Halorientalis halophila TaxID=3108499 RepID=UPI003008593D